MTTALASLLVDIDVLEGRGDDPAQVEVRAVTQDSRAAVPGALYCCVVGASFDGHDFAAAAVDRGATSLLVERFVSVPAPVAQIRVRSTRRAVAPVAAAFWGDPSARMDVVGVTGTNGKTTTTELLAAICEAAGRRCGVIGTLSGQRTTPEAPVLQARLASLLESGCAAVAMEVSSIALDQHRADAIDFAVAVWTNLTQDHLDYHRTMEAYFTAKAALFLSGRSRLAVVNLDDPYGRRLLPLLRIPVQTYSLRDAESLRVGLHSSSFSWHGQHIALNVGGRHNVVNALGAATAAQALGIGPAAVAGGLESIPGIAGRFEVIDEGQDFTVIVDYAHTPDGLERLLLAAREADPPRVLIVFGCGGERDRAKRPMMADVATRLADVAVLTSDNPRHEDPLAIIAEIAAGAPDATRAHRLVIEPERRAAIRLAMGRAGPGDVVIIAGKGHEQEQIMGDVAIPFDDRQVAREVLRAGAEGVAS